VTNYTLRREDFIYRFLLISKRRPDNVTNIVDYPTAANTTLISTLKTKLRVSIPGMVFSDDL
jgi:hypothetical protein